MRIPERASTFLRDVKRRSQRVKRSKSLIARNPDCRLSGSFVQLNEEEVRQKYIEDVKREREWRKGCGGDDEDFDDEQLHAAAAAATAASPELRRQADGDGEAEQQCTCACRVHQQTTTSTSATPRRAHHLLTATTPMHTTAGASGRLVFTPIPGSPGVVCPAAALTPADDHRFDLSPRSSGHFRKLSSPSLQDMQEDKENMQPARPAPPPATPTASLGPPPATPNFSSARRRCSRRSSLFTPSFKKLSHLTSTGQDNNDTAAAITPYKKGSVRTLPIDKKAKKSAAANAATAVALTTSTTNGVEETGQGRIIPIKQGYLYKKSGASRIYRRKYVTLCSDGTMTYYPTFQAYVDNTHSKEIHLQHVTVKIPGQKPTGLKSTTNTTTATTTSNGQTPDLLQSAVTSSSSSSSDEFDREMVGYNNNSLPHNHQQPQQHAEQNGKKTETKTPKRKRHRLSDEHDTPANNSNTNTSSSLFELVIVSLDSRQWQFQLCSQEEGEQWVQAIQHQIHRSLRAGTESSAAPTTETSSSAAYPSSATIAGWMTSSSLQVVLANNGGGVTADEIETVRVLPGNSECADCGAAAPGWASLNLGTLICIECSGIHRNLGTHISRVRSLDLDSWSAANLGVLRAIGNRLANAVWEAAIHQNSCDSETLSPRLPVKPSANSARQHKENFIKSKYLSKSFLGGMQKVEEGVANGVKEVEVYSGEHLVRAIQSGDMQLFLSALLRLNVDQLNSEENSAKCSPLQLAINSNNLQFAQLLVWNNADTSMLNYNTDTAKVQQRNADTGDTSGEFFSHNSSRSSASSVSASSCTFSYTSGPDTKKVCPRESQLL